MNDLSPKRQDKFRAYRARKKAAGLREIRMWIPDFRDPVVQKAIDDQARRVNASPDSKRVLEEIEQWTADLWRDTP